MILDGMKEVQISTLQDTLADTLELIGVVMNRRMTDIREENLNFNPLNDEVTEAIELHLSFYYNYYNGSEL